MNLLEEELTQHCDGIRSYSYPFQFPGCRLRIRKLEKILRQDYKIVSMQLVIGH